MNKEKIIDFLKQIIFVIVFVGIATLVRVLLFSGLGRGIPYLTFYPVIALIVLYGTFTSGIIATVISFFLTYFWIQKGNLSQVEIMAEVVFIVSCVIILLIGGAKNRIKNELKTKNNEILQKNINLANGIKVREQAVDELNRKIIQSDQINKSMVGRELKMIELKKRIAELEANQKV